MEYVETESALRLERVALETADLKAALKHLRPGDGLQLERDGQVLGAVISPRDLQLYLELLRHYEDRLDNAAADEAKAEPGERVPIERLLEEFGIAVRA